METEADEQFIEWDHERYSSHIERFDDQHQRLFELLNDLYLAMEEGRSEEKVGEILRELEAYTEYHFGDEEEFMQDCGFAMDCSECFYNHREMHEQFAEKVTELREKHENGEYISMEMLLFARDWLDSHIAGLNQDQSYAEYYVDEVPEEYDYEPGQLKKGRTSESDPHSGETATGSVSQQSEMESNEQSETDAPEQAETAAVADQDSGPEAFEDTVTLGTDIHKSGSLDVPAESMATWVEQLETEYATLPAARLEQDGTFVPHSYGELLDEARSLAAGLLDYGLEPGDRVGFYLPPGYQWSVLDFACYQAGLVSVPVSKLYRPRRAAYVIEDAGVDLLVTDGTLPEPAQEAVDTVFEFDLAPRVTSPTLPELDQGPDDVASVVYRIGTTDHPNGCAMTHRNLRAAIEMLGETFEFETGWTGTCFLPLGHMYQRVLTYALLDTGAAVAYMDPDEFLDQLSAVEPEVLVGVPQVYRELYETVQSRTDEVSGLRQALSNGVAQSVGRTRDEGESVSTHLSLKHTVSERTVFSPLRSELGLGNIEHALSGTEAIDSELVQFFRGFGVPISELYGATEISGLATINRAGSYRAGTVGTPFRGVEIALAEDDEILVRGDNVIDGYWNDARSWRRTLCEGWYRTGDLGTFDEEGALQVLGPK